MAKVLDYLHPNASITVVEEFWIICSLMLAMPWKTLD